MLKLCVNNYLSVMKHRAKLLSMFKDGKQSEILGLNVLRKENLFFTIFNDEIDFKKAYLSFIRKPCLMLWGGCVEKFLIYDNKSYELLNVVWKSDIIEVSSIFSDLKIDIFDYSYYRGINETLLDTALFHNFYLNAKNCNNTSLLVLLDGYNLFFLKRKNLLCLCGLQL